MFVNYVFRRRLWVIFKCLCLCVDLVTTPVSVSSFHTDVCTHGKNIKTRTSNVFLPWGCSIPHIRQDIPLNLLIQCVTVPWFGEKSDDETLSHGWPGRQKVNETLNSQWVSEWTAVIKQEQIIVFIHLFNSYYIIGTIQNLKLHILSLDKTIMLDCWEGC